eukprot:1391429-Pyramimonas_sp.AAC.1
MPGGARRTVAAQSYTAHRETANETPACVADGAPSAVASSIVAPSSRPESVAACTFAPVGP